MTKTNFIISQKREKNALKHKKRRKIQKIFCD